MRVVAGEGSQRSTIRVSYPRGRHSRTLAQAAAGFQRGAAEPGRVTGLRPTRVLALAALALVSFLYWKPVHTYLRTKHALEVRQAQVRSLQAEKVRLETKIKLANTNAELIKQARKLGLVRPGEQMFQVTGISAWRQRHH
jgi:cell division protein FtsB